MLEPLAEDDERFSHIKKYDTHSMPIQGLVLKTFSKKHYLVFKIIHSQISC